MRREDYVAHPENTIFGFRRDNKTVQILKSGLKSQTLHYVKASAAVKKK